MLTKEEYFKIREEEAIPLSLFYDYFTEVCTDNRQIKTLEEFEQYFPQFMATFYTGMMITKENNVKFISFNGIIAKVYKHFDKKFEI